MDCAELRDWLNFSGIPPAMYSFGRDGGELVIFREGDDWIVGTYDRGELGPVQRFSSEHEACLSVLEYFNIKIPPAAPQPEPGPPVVAFPEGDMLPRPSDISLSARLHVDGALLTRLPVEDGLLLPLSPGVTDEPFLSAKPQ